MHLSTSIGLIAALWAIALFQALLIMALLRQVEEVRELLRTVDVADVPTTVAGNPAPQFETIGLASGRTLNLDTVLGRGGVLLFLSSQCNACGQLASSIDAQSTTPDNLIILWSGEPNDLVSRLAARANTATAHVARIAAAYQVRGFPTAVMLNEEALIAGYTHPHDYADVAKLFARSTTSAGQRPPQLEISQTTMHSTMAGAQVGA